MNVTVNMPDYWAELLETKQKSDGARSRHATILRAIGTYIGAPNETIGADPETWPVIDKTEVCEGCDNGKHCGHKVRVVDLSSVKQRRRYACVCPRCGDGRR
jgi:hypothetical protein